MSLGRIPSGQTHRFMRPLQPRPLCCALWAQSHAHASVVSKLVCHGLQLPRRRIGTAKASSVPTHHTEKSMLSRCKAIMTGKHDNGATVANKNRAQTTGMSTKTCSVIHQKVLWPHRRSLASTVTNGYPIVARCAGPCDLNGLPSPTHLTTRYCLTRISAQQMILWAIRQERRLFTHDGFQ